MYVVYIPILYIELDLLLPASDVPSKRAFATSSAVVGLSAAACIGCIVVGRQPALAATKA